MNFEAYSTKMMDSLTVLQENNVRYEPWQWVDFLLNGIDVSANQMVHTAKSIIRFDDNLKNDFTLASNKLSEFITKETPAIDNTAGRGGGPQCRHWCLAAAAAHGAGLGPRPELRALVGERDNG